MNPKDPQADIEAILKYVYERALVNLQTAHTDPYDFAVRSARVKLLALFQAHQQELLSELLGELPEKELPQVEPGAMIIEHEGKLVKTEHLAKMRNTGFNQAIDQVVSVIEKYREGL